MNLTSQLRKHFVDLDAKAQDYRSKLDVLQAEDSRNRELHESDVITESELNRRLDDTAERAKALRESFEGEIDGVRDGWEKASRSVRVLNEVDLKRLAPVLDSVAVNAVELEQLFADNMDSYTNCRALVTYASRNGFEALSTVKDAALTDYFDSLNTSFEQLCGWCKTYVGSQDAKSDESSLRSFYGNATSKILENAEDAERVCNHALSGDSKPSFNLEVELARAAAGNE